MFCVQIVLENGDLHPISTNTLFKKPYLSNVSLVFFESSCGHRNRRPESCAKSLGVKV
jgi:hypothetical protein